MEAQFDLGKMSYHRFHTVVVFVHRDLKSFHHERHAILQNVWYTCTFKFCPSRQTRHSSKGLVYIMHVLWVLSPRETQYSSKCLVYMYFKVLPLKTDPLFFGRFGIHTLVSPACPSRQTRRPTLFFETVFLFVNYFKETFQIQIQRLYCP